MLEAVAQTDHVDEAVDPPPVARRARKVEGQPDILRDGQRQHRVERLEHEAGAVPAQQGQPAVVRGPRSVSPV
jgi:hypothetical protein